MMKQPTMMADNYDCIDGRSAYSSEVKKLTLGAATLPENEKMQIAAQIWKQNAAGELEMRTELPIHQIFDLMIFLGRSLLHCKEAYRLPLLYDPENPVVDRVGLQGDAMTIAVCADNPHINEDMMAFSQAVSDLGELTGERLRTLIRILEKLDHS